MKNFPEKVEDMGEIKIIILKKMIYKNFVLNFEFDNLKYCNGDFLLFYLL